MKTRKMALWLIVVLALTILACSRSGQIYTPEEATRRAEPTPFPTFNPDDFAQGDISVGEKATLIGQQLLVNILDNPTGRVIGGEARGTTVTVQQSAEADGEIWYQIETSSGQIGWVRATNLEAEAGSAGTEGNLLEGALEVGDTFAISGKLLLVNILESPSPVGKIVGGVARGEIVTVVQVTRVGDKFWYQVETSGGTGWVSEDNVPTEDGAE